MVTMVKVSDLLRNLKGSIDVYELDVPSEWLRMIAWKSEDYQFATIIRLIETEGFTDPIGIRMYDDDNWELGNGHHRLSAAILLGLDEIPVVMDDTWPESGDRYSHVQKQITDNDRANSRWIANQVSDYTIGDRELVSA